MPLDALAQSKGQGLPVFAPLPGSGKFRPDRLNAVPGHMLVEQHEVVEHGHEGDDDGRRPLLLDRWARRRVDVRNGDRAAALLCQRWWARRGQGAGEQAQDDAPHRVTSLFRLRIFRLIRAGWPDAAAKASGVTGLALTGWYG